MGSGTIRLHGNWIVALTGVRSLEADSALTADRKQRNVCPRVARRRAARARNLRGSPATCVQDIKKFACVRCQHLDGVHPTGATGGVGHRRQVAHILIDPEARDLMVLRAGNIEITDCVIRTAGGHSQSRSKGYCQGQRNPAKFPELHAFPSSRSLSRSRAACAAKLSKLDTIANCKS